MSKCKHETYYDETGERCRLCHVYVRTAKELVKSSRSAATPPVSETSATKKESVPSAAGAGESSADSTGNQ